MFDKLELLVEKFEELEKKIIDPEIMKDMNVWQKLAKEHGDMKPIVEKYREYSKHKKELEENKEMLKESLDDEMKELQPTFDRSVDIMKSFVLQGINNTMNQYNKFGKKNR